MDEGRSEWGRDEWNEYRWAEDARAEWIGYLVIAGVAAIGLLVLFVSVWLAMR